MQRIRAHVADEQFSARAIDSRSATSQPVLARRREYLAVPTSVYFILLACLLAVILTLWAMLYIRARLIRERGARAEALEAMSAAARGDVPQTKERPILWDVWLPLREDPKPLTGLTRLRPLCIDAIGDRISLPSVASMQQTRLEALFKLPHLPPGAAAFMPSPQPRRGPFARFIRAETGPGRLSPSTPRVTNARVIETQTLPPKIKLAPRLQPGRPVRVGMVITLPGGEVSLGILNSHLS